MENNFKITPNFSIYELTKSSQHPQFNDENLAFAMMPENLSKGFALALLAEEARSVLGCPLQVGAGFRFKDLNDAVGGNPESQHLLFEAIDFTPMRDTPNTHESMSLDLTRLLSRFSEREVMFGQLIAESQFDIDEGETDFWFHISLGHPFRPLTRCRHVLENDCGTWKNIARLSTMAWAI